MNIVWKTKVDKQVEEELTKRLEDNSNIDGFLEDDYCNLTNFLAFEIRDNGIYQVTGQDKLFPSDWICVKEEKFKEFEKILTSEE